MFILHALKVFVVKPNGKLYYFSFICSIINVIFKCIFPKKMIKSKLPCRTLCCANDFKVGSWMLQPFSYGCLT